MLFVFIPRVSLRLPWAMCLLGLQPTLPKSETLVSYYIMEYRKEYDRESLIGTEYEYLLHEDDELFDKEHKTE